ncbi:hypothetical protein [Actinoplanes philippinensis]|uniref:hypothetical protein n=1 Tax=Actinoplanes philippinensis TaxID=35752 RepID=UPI0033D2D764
MPYRSPDDFCAEYVELNGRDTVDEFGATSRLETVTVAGRTPDTARVEARRFIFGHAPDAGYYDAVEPTVFVLSRHADGWHVISEESLPYE